MLHQISWFTYAVSILSLVLLYYVYVGVTFYRAEIHATFYKLTGRQPMLKTSGKGDLQIPDYDIMGKAQQDDVEVVDPGELSFGPLGIPDESKSEEADKMAIPAGTGSRLIVEFSEMISEVKTLIRVINESSESKENFEMLFRLITQKYSALVATAFQHQINEFLISEGVPQFPFSLTETDLENYWKNEA